MANQDVFGGLRLLRCKPNGMHVYRVASDYGTALFPGDPVVLTGTGVSDPRSLDGAYATVQIATVSSTITGVMCGVVYLNSTAPAIPTSNYMPASTGGLVLVCDDPDAEFVIQEDSVGGNIAATAIGEFCDLVFNSGDATTGLSKVELDSSDAGTGDNVRIMRLYDAPGNAVGANADWVVTINEHTYKAVSTPV